MATYTLPEKIISMGDFNLLAELLRQMQPAWPMAEAETDNDKSAGATITIVGELTLTAP